MPLDNGRRHKETENEKKNAITALGTGVRRLDSAEIWTEIFKFQRQIQIGYC